MNFAKTLIHLQELPDSKVKQFLQTTINQAHKLGDLRAESYGFGYLGKLYEERKEWELAKNSTQKAWFLAQSIPAPDIEYQWEWQLGRIYKPQAAQREKAQTKGMQEGWKNLQQGREMYKRAFQTLQSLRTELVGGNPDAQVFFQNDIEGIYREYIDLLLWDDKPAQEYLSQAREVIASLQAVELENFLRVACPENNLEQIDEIITKQAKKTAFLYPIVLDDRVEVILKLPTNSTQRNSASQGLEHYRTPIERTKVEEQIKKLQLDLEEEYTFDDVQREAREVYGWLVEGAKKYISKDIDTLVFALDTNLRNIPLAALVYDVKLGKPQYLVDKYAIALAPRLKIPNPRLLQGKTLKILAAGLSESKEDQQFPELRFVTQELNAIKEAGKSKVSVSQLINGDFKIKKFNNKLNSDIFQVLHFATHGEFSSNPEKTFILASDKPIKVNEIDNLFRKQAQNQPEPIELLVLSACETAAGDRRATLGISGVAVRAGARSAIASLWTLDDEISVDFTKLFYKQLIDPKVTTKAQALRQAQKVLKELPGREHPRYWASYILVGNWL